MGKAVGKESCPFKVSEYICHTSSSHRPISSRIIPLQGCYFWPLFPAANKPANFCHLCQEICDMKAWNESNDYFLIDCGEPVRNTTTGAITETCSLTSNTVT